MIRTTICNAVKKYAFLTLAGFVPAVANAQVPVTGVYTNYRGFWATSTANNSSVLPDSSHALLAFTYNSKTFSTGVSDAKLTANGVSYHPADFQALSLSNTAINSSGSVIGVGDLYGGGSGDVSPRPVSSNLAQYLNDGPHGLDLGTAVFNLPAATNLSYPVNHFNVNAVNDSIPDILLTQVGQPPAANKVDVFFFEDSIGKRVGNAISISLAGVDVLGTGKWKFYNPGNASVTYNAGLYGTRPLRMVGFDLADFGITAADFNKVFRFVHHLSGESDQAFIAYNTASFTAATGTVLPVKLVSFTAAQVQDRALLNWSVAEARSFSHFEIERNAGGDEGFRTIASVAAKAGEESSYQFSDEAPSTGTNYYRLKMIDQNGAYTYSQVRSLAFAGPLQVAVYPNPAASTLYITIPASSGQAVLYDAYGKEAIALSAGAEGQIRIDVSALPQGIYTLQIRSGSAVMIKKITIAH